MESAGAVEVRKSKTFAIGNIHGAYKSLIQCLARSRFDYNNDRLIVMGDVVDGYPDAKQCFDELLKIKYCDMVIGNHDLWALDWALRGDKPEIWTSEGLESDIEEDLMTITEDIKEKILNEDEYATGRYSQGAIPVH